MPKLCISFLIFLLPFFLIAQGKKRMQYPISDCEGAIHIFKTGIYQLQFTGHAGRKKELVNYPSLASFSSENLIWLSFIPEDDGTLSLQAELESGNLKMVVFSELNGSICEELTEGKAEIKRLLKSEENRRVGLNRNVSNGTLYPLDLLAGQKIVIAFCAAENSKEEMHLNFQFAHKFTGRKAPNESLKLDTRNDDFAPTFTIKVRDIENGKPVTAKITIEGARELAAVYTASDVLFNVARGGKVVVKCDAEGYFFEDTVMNIVSQSEGEMLLLLEPLARGKSIQIEQIQFKPGTSEFLPGAEMKLNRLKDFLALNTAIHIEIQGHVFYSGSNNLASQKMSEARAKRVMQYLLEYGIAKERMEAVGFGNTKPVHPKPKLANEEQVNRRVEILVK
jgi:outer membrane protein OmpA-like peptidoglycan-associated protein